MQCNALRSQTAAARCITRIILLNLACLTANCALAQAAFAQVYPSRPIRWIIDFPPGGPSDALPRVIGQKLTESLGQPIVYDNRPGANGVIAYGLAARASPDGYTLTVLS